MPTNKHDLIELEYKLAKLQLQLAIGILDSNVRNIRRLHNLETEYIEELAYGGDESPLHIEPPVALAKSKPEPKTKTRPKLRPWVTLRITEETATEKPQYSSERPISVGPCYSEHQWLEMKWIKMLEKYVDDFEDVEADQYDDYYS